MATNNQASSMIDDYIGSFEPEVQDRLKKIRNIIREAAPDAEETIAYKMPTYRLNGNLVHFAAFNNHIGFYPTPNGIEAFQKEISKYKSGKGSVQFPHEEPLPYDLVRKIVSYRVAVNSKNKDAEKNKSQLNNTILGAMGKDWNDWFTILEKSGAAGLAHADIARLLSEKYKVDGWWAQNITVQFERHIGRRNEGQVKDGTYQTAVSKTLKGDIDRVFEAWLKAAGQSNSFNSVSIEGERWVSKSDRWRYWRTEMQDGSKLTVSVGYKKADKSILTMGMEKLSDQESLKSWKEFWGEYLKTYEMN